MSELFSSNLVRIRKARGLSQRDLASKAGLTQRMVNFYEHNPQSLPIARLKSLAHALNVKVSDFFNEEESTSIDTLDVRWLKKLQEIQSLPESDRKEINRHLNSLLEKQRLKNQARS